MSRVADQLGKGSSFTRARGGVSARRQAVAATAGAPTAGAPDSRLRTLPLTQLVPTRFNPRRNFGTDEDLREFGLKLKKKQLQPAVAVTREAYLSLWPEEADHCRDAPYVIANGERRYRASLAVQQDTLEVVVDDEIARSRADFLDAVLSENVDREDLDPIERAIGVRTMVEQLGGYAEVAEHYQKTKGWVSQQVQLLSLAPELQDRVSAGEIPVREARALVKLPPAEQTAAWESRLVQRAEERARPAARRKTPALPDSPPPVASVVSGPPVAPGPEPDPAPFTAVNGPATTDPAAVDTPKPFTAVNTSDAVGTPPPDSPAGLHPAPAIPAPGGKLQMKMPWANGVASMDIIYAKLSQQERRRAVGRYLDLLGGPEDLVADLVAASTPEYRRAVAELLMRDMTPPQESDPTT